MATAKPADQPRRRPALRRTLLAIGLVVLLVLAVFGQRIGRYATAAAAVGARSACSCRFVGGRELGDCRKDFEPGMGVVMLNEDAMAKSLTARVPLISRQTATFRNGEGCTLEPWAD
jgi:hypothetical protein